MAKSPAELVRELNNEIIILRERDVTQRRELDIVSDGLKAEQDARQRLEVEIAALRQQLQDHIKHADLVDGRRWTLILALFGAALSLASGLIVTLAKK
ncbi:hypothetical protein R5W23_005221 [Gemmata sp. JC673]|uniref:DUF1640 domain-containing protein n=1 Tax=Gemmata algarum TaxID=2975278 RepID=A0ABU5FA04_9BACT|nr:hypothetical protein [Gemmata algarum]MDY3563607.1 hypothetical protein [Gemmata algarum]